MPAAAAAALRRPLRCFDDEAWAVPDEDDAPDEDWTDDDFDPLAPGGDESADGFDEDGFDDDLEPELPDWARRRNLDEEE